MASIDALRASDGSENANLATVQSTRAALATTISVDTVTGWPDNFYASMGTPHTFVDPVTSETITVISEDTAVDFKGHIDGGNIEIDTIAPGYTDGGSAVGDIVIVKPTTQWADDVADVLSQAHNDDGSIKDDAVTEDTILNNNVTQNKLSTNLQEGWLDLADTPDTVTANGNRSYDLVFNSNDLTDTVSPGMRLQLTRTVAAPDQCTSLDGSSQYWSKSSPSGLSNWTAYTNTAHIYPTAYQDATISRCVTSTTNGWALTMMSTGQIRAFYGTASNFTDFVTYQSVPLNRWSHVAVRVTSTSSKTAEILINGVVVPSYSSITAATSMTQGGTLTIGATSTPSTYFPGKLAQVGLFSTALTAAEILDYSTYGLSGSETSCVGFFSFDGNGNDSSSNANNLTASGSATATNDDSPFKNYGATTNKEYAIVMKAAFSTNTTLTVQVPEGCAIPTSGGVSAVYYSTQSVPYGFPRAVSRWDLELKLRVTASQTSPTSGTWYNLSSLKVLVPVGMWDTSYLVSAAGDRASASQIKFNTTLSTANNSESDTDFTATAEASSVTILNTQLTASKVLNIASAAPYYWNMRAQFSSATTIYYLADRGTGYIRLRNAYL